MNKNDLQQHVENRINAYQEKKAVLEELIKDSQDKFQIKDYQDDKSSANKKEIFWSALHAALPEIADLIVQHNLNEKSLDAIGNDSKSLAKFTQLFKALAGKGTITDSSTRQYLPYLQQNMDQKQIHFDEFRKNMFQIKTGHEHECHIGFRQSQMNSKMLERLGCGKIIQTNDKRVSGNESSSCAFVPNPKSKLLQKILALYA